MFSTLTVGLFVVQLNYFSWLFFGLQNVFTFGTQKKAKREQMMNSFLSFDNYVQQNSYRQLNKWPSTDAWITYLGYQIKILDL